MQLRSYRAVTEKKGSIYYCGNGSFASFKNSHFQNKAKSKTFLVKMSFICMMIKNHLHIKWNGFVLNFAMKQRLGATRKWPIKVCIVEYAHGFTFHNAFWCMWQHL